MTLGPCPEKERISHTELWWQKKKKKNQKQKQGLQFWNEDTMGLMHYKQETCSIYTVMHMEETMS